MKKMSKETLFKLGKIGILVAGAVVAVGEKFFEEKEFDEKVAKKVAETLADQAKES